MYVHTFREFNIGRYAVHLIYNQTLLWCGLFFCPLTPVIVVIKIMIMFYIQKVCSFTGGEKQLLMPSFSFIVTRNQVEGHEVDMKSVWSQSKMLNGTK